MGLTRRRLKSGVAVEPVREKLHTTFRAFQAERARGWNRADQTVYRSIPQPDLTAGARALGRLHDAERLPPFAGRARRTRGVGAARRVRERRQPASDPLSWATRDLPEVLFIADDQS